MIENQNYDFNTRGIHLVLDYFKLKKFSKVAEKHHLSIERVKHLIYVELVNRLLLDFNGFPNLLLLEEDYKRYLQQNHDSSLEFMKWRRYSNAKISN
jgi:hypothetical protein